jgi:hypothetical protein
MISQLQEIFDSRTKALEVFYLLKDLKKVVRQGFYPHELEKVEEFAKKNNIFIEKSPYKVVLQDKEMFSNKGNIVPVDSKKGMFLVYFSKDHMNALWTCLYETRQDHKNTGVGLGYPKCCVDFFVSEFGKGNHNPAHRPLNPWTNLLLRDDDVVLLSHFPCRSDCEKSVAMGKERLALIKKYDNELAKEFYKKLSV